jgi:hypothetical protein
MINVACPFLQPAQYRPATAYCIKLGKSGTRRSPEVYPGSSFVVNSLQKHIASGQL